MPEQTPIPGSEQREAQTNALQYPFVKQETIITNDISFDPKIITELTAYEGYTSIIEKIIVINQDDQRPAVVTLKLGIQTEQKLEHPETHEEITDYTITYEILLRGECIQPGETKILQITDFPQEYNKFLMLQTEDDTQIVNCCVLQTIQVNTVY